MKFTFKTEKPTGRFSWTHRKHHYIKFKKKRIGEIVDSSWKIRFKILKTEKFQDDNPNCKWMWIQMKNTKATLEETKEYLNQNIETFFKAYTFVDDDHNVVEFE